MIKRNPERSEAEAFSMNREDQLKSLKAEVKELTK